MELAELIQVVSGQGPVFVLLIVVLWKQLAETSRLRDLLTAARQEHVSDLRRLADDMQSLVAALSARNDAERKLNPQKEAGKT